MFLNKNKENNVYPCKPQFYCIKVGFRGSKLYRHVSVMVVNLILGPNNVYWVQALYEDDSSATAQNTRKRVLQYMKIDRYHHIDR